MASAQNNTSQSINVKVPKITPKSASLTIELMWKDTNILVFTTSQAIVNMA